MWSGYCSSVRAGWDGNCKLGRMVVEIWVGLGWTVYLLIVEVSKYDAKS